MALTYNGVTFDYILTQRFELTPEQDPSRTDQVGTKFRLRVRSILYPGVNPSNPGETPADAMKRIRHMLLQKRKALIYAVNGTTVVSTTGRDDANGPETTCEFSQLNAGSFLVDFTVETTLTDCAGGSGYLSLKWSDTISRDWQWITTRRRIGTLVVSPLRTTDPDSMRPIVTPDVPTGFRRETADYTLSEDGRIIRFTFVDKEMMTPPPRIAVRMRGVQSESAAPPGVLKVGQIRLRLDGTKGVVKKDLLAAAIFAGMSRVYASGIQTGKDQKLLAGWSVSEGLGDDECWVELQVNWRIKPDDKRSDATGESKKSSPSTLSWLLNPGLAATGVAVDAVTPQPPPQPNESGINIAAISGAVPWLGSAIPNSDPNRVVGPPANGLANAVKLIAAALNDPCGQNGTITEGDGGFDAELRTGGPAFGTGVLTGNEPVTVTDSGTGTLTAQVVPASAIPPDDEAALFGDDRPGVYDEYTIVAHYKDITGKVVLPSTKAGEPAREVQLHNRRLKLTVEWSAAKVGGPPVYPKAANSPDGLAIYLGGTISPTEVELAADGVSPRYEITGVYDYEFTRPDLASVTAPLPPYISCDLADDANRILAFNADCIVFPGSASTATNPFTGNGTTDVACCGTNGVMVGGGLGGGFNPGLGSGVNP